MFLDDETAAQLIALMAEHQRINTQMASFIARVIGARGDHSPGPVVVPTEGTQPERLLAYIRQRPDGCTRRDLTEAFPEMSDNSLSAATMRLKERGSIDVLGRGRYRARAR